MSMYSLHAYRESSCNSVMLSSWLFLQPFQWNPVILRYDGSSLSAAIGDVSKTIYVEGTLTVLYI